MPRRWNVLAVAAIVALSGSCRAPGTGAVPTLEHVASSEAQWTGLAVSADGRLFVNYPRWSDDVPISVAELVDGVPVPYPDAALNAWSPGEDPAAHFVCVQSIHVDAADRLWILDPANPGFGGVVPGGPKLLQVDLAADTVVRTYRFDATVAPADSYLNDVRVDVARDVAFLTDSEGAALVVLDLASGAARRVLDGDPSTSAEDVTLTIGGRPWVRDGVPPQVHADGIAYDPGSDTVYYQALTGRTMYRLPAAALRDVDVSAVQLALLVEPVGRTGASDALIAGPDGHVYISALEHDAILRTTPDGEVETVVTDPAIAWPDSFAFGPDGWLYFTTARIHEGPAPTAPYGIHRVDVRR